MADSEKRTEVYPWTHSRRKCFVLVWTNVVVVMAKVALYSFHIYMDLKDLEASRRDAEAGITIEPLSKFAIPLSWSILEVTSSVCFKLVFDYTFLRTLVKPPDAKRIAFCCVCEAIYWIRHAWLRIFLVVPELLIVTRLAWYWGNGRILITVILCIVDVAVKSCGIHFVRTFKNDLKSSDLISEDDTVLMNNVPCCVGRYARQ